MTFEINSFSEWLLGVERITGHEIEADGSQGKEVRLIRIGLLVLTITLYL